MLFIVVQLIVGLVLLTAGAEGLVRGSASLALRLRLTPLVIGLTVVAFGTSLPELVVSVGAALGHQGDIAVGNVVGSNIFNIGAILGLTALVCPIRVSLQVIRSDGPLMIAASLICLGLVSHGRISRAAGLCLFILLAAYTAYSIRLAKKEAISPAALPFSEGMPSMSRSWAHDGVFISGGLALLVVGSRLLVVSAVAIANQLGISQAVIGLTIVAAGTSLPELATSLVAALHRQPDIAVGNIVGSNLFNILGIMGISAMVTPLSTEGITRIDLWTMVAFAVGLLPMLYTGLRLHRWEGGVLLAGYAAYLWHLWPMR